MILSGLKPTKTKHSIKTNMFTENPHIEQKKKLADTLPDLI